MRRRGDICTKGRVLIVVVASLRKSLMSYVSSLVGLSRLEINAEADGHIGIELDEDVRHSVPTQ